MASSKAPWELHWRRLDHEWPAALQSLWHAAMALYEASETLEALRWEGVTIARGYDTPIGTAVDQADEALRVVEQMAAPLLAAYDEEAGR